MNEKYRKYLASAEWKAKRDERMRMDRYLCFNCRSPFNLVVHHVSYENLYHEEMEDLITLCRECHKHVHSANAEEWMMSDMDSLWNDCSYQSYTTDEMCKLLSSLGGDMAMLSFLLKNKDEDNILAASVKTMEVSQ